MKISLNKINLYKKIGWLPTWLLQNETDIEQIVTRGTTEKDKT